MAHPYSNLSRFIVDTVNDINFFMFNTEEEKYVGLNYILQMNLVDLGCLVESNLRKHRITLDYLQKMRKMATRYEQDEYCQNIAEEVEDIARLEALLYDLATLQALKEQNIDLNL